MFGIIEINICAFLPLLYKLISFKILLDLEDNMDIQVYFVTKE